MRKTSPIDPRRLRRIPSQFSWLDHRLVRHRRICGLDPHALGLYLFLATVSDTNGISYYGGQSIAGYIPALGSEQLQRARSQLLERSLIAYEAPFYQVLDLHPRHFDAPTTSRRKEQP